MDCNELLQSGYEFEEWLLPSQINLMWYSWSIMNSSEWKRKPEKNKLRVLSLSVLCSHLLLTMNHTRPIAVSILCCWNWLQIFLMSAIFQPAGAHASFIFLPALLWWLQFQWSCLSRLQMLPFPWRNQAVLAEVMLLSHYLAWKALMTFLAYLVVVFERTAMLLECI